MKEMKTDLSVKRSLNIMDRFTRSEYSNHSIQSKQIQNPDPTKLLYDRAIEQDIRIYPLKIHHVITHKPNHNHDSEHLNESRPLPNAISPSPSSHRRIHSSQSHHSTRPDHLFTNRPTSSPLILLSAPIEHLLILQLYRLSHSSFHDKTTPLSIQVQRAASLLDLLNRQRGRDSADTGNGIEGGANDASVTISTIRMTATAVMATTWLDATEEDIKWIHAHGPRSLEEVSQRVMDAQQRHEGADEKTQNL